MPSRRNSPALTSTITDAQPSAGAVAPTSARTSTPALPSADISTTVQLPFSTGQVIDWTPSPLDCARQIATSAGNVFGAVPRWSVYRVPLGPNEVTVAYWTRARQSR